MALAKPGYMSRPDPPPAAPEYRNIVEILRLRFTSSVQSLCIEQKTFHSSELAIFQELLFPAGSKGNAIATRAMTIYKQAQMKIGTGVEVYKMSAPNSIKA